MLALNGALCSLRILTTGDARALSELATRNKRYWSVHEPLQEDAYYTERACSQRIADSLSQMRLQREYTFGIFAAGTGELIGYASIYSIKRMPFSSALIGYSLDERAAGNGIATNAVELLIAFGMQKLGLHRIEAYVSPKNAGSIRVLEKNRLEREGLLRRFLFINGAWEDHFYYSILAEDF